MTSYLIDILENDPITVIIVYSVISISAPMGGVLMGGIFADIPIVATQPNLAASIVYPL